MHCVIHMDFSFHPPLHTISLFFFFSGVPDSLIHTVMSSSSFQDIFLPLSFSILPRAFKYYISPCERRIYQMSSLALFFIATSRALKRATVHCWQMVFVKKRWDARYATVTMSTQHTLWRPLNWSYILENIYITRSVRRSSS